MWEQQHEYYVHMGSKKQGITWGTKLCQKLIEATHLLWSKRNSFEHDRKLHELIEVEDIRLKGAIKSIWERNHRTLKIRQVPI